MLAPVLKFKKIGSFCLSFWSPESLCKECSNFSRGGYAVRRPSHGQRTWGMQFCKGETKKHRGTRWMSKETILEEKCPSPDSIAKDVIAGINSLAELFLSTTFSKNKERCFKSLHFGVILLTPIHNQNKFVFFQGSGAHCQDLPSFLGLFCFL